MTISPVMHVKNFMSKGFDYFGKCETKKSKQIEIEEPENDLKEFAIASML